MRGHCDSGPTIVIKKSKQLVTWWLQWSGQDR
jgi:hypothetical protein